MHAALSLMALTVPRLLVGALLALALVPTAARADDIPPAVPVPAADALMTTAHSLAVARWGMEPCGGQVTVAWAHMGAGINARSQWMSTDVHDPATYSDCSISYNLDVDWDWPKICTVVEHELGHLSGHDHVNDPHDVMSPYYVYPSPECAAGQPAGAPVATPVSASAPTKGTSPASSRKAATRKATTRKDAKRKAAKRKAAKRKAKARKAGAKARKAAAKTRAATPRARVRVAVAADSSAHVGLFGCVLASA
jgi:hypothetical protein